MKTNVCIECGSTIPEDVDPIPYTCDGCGRSICKFCYNDISTVHTTRPTALGMTGFLKLCKECRQTYKDVIKTIERPYLG